MTGPRFARAGRKVSARSQQGFSLLEVLVAFAILAMSLGLLYQISGSNARATGSVIGQDQAVVLAQSLLAAHAAVPAEGVQAQGESQGFAWQVKTAPFQTAVQPSSSGVPQLHEIQVQVTWPDGGNERAYQLRSIRPERPRLPDARSQP